MKLESRGQWMAFGFAVLVLSFGMVPLYFDKPLWSLAAMIGVLTQIIAVFISSRHGLLAWVGLALIPTSVVELPAAPE